MKFRYHHRTQKHRLLFLVLSLNLSACLKTSAQLNMKDETKSTMEDTNIKDTDSEDLPIIYADWCHSNACSQLQWSPLREGFFMMGDGGVDLNHSPLLSVSLEAFQMLISEVTVGQYRACVNLGVCNPPSSCDQGKGTWTDQPKTAEGTPINCVTFEEAKVFATWAGGRLPTEAEWEYAARSEGIEGLYPWGERSPNCEYSNFLECIQAPTAVCQFPNGHSYQEVCDLTGNLLEWVDRFESQKMEGFEMFEIGKGGSWIHPVEALTASYRFYISPTARLPYLGFRVVK